MRRRQVASVLTVDRVIAAYRETKISPLQFEWARKVGKECFACPATVVAIQEGRIARDDVFAEGAALRHRIPAALNVSENELFFFALGVDGDSYARELDDEAKALVELGKQVWSAVQKL